MKYILKLFLIILTFSESISAQEIEWQNTIGGSAPDYFESIQQTSDGGYICGGYTNSDISGDKSENSNGGGDLWVVKLDSAGAIQWQNTIGGSIGESLFADIRQTADGGYICGGNSESDISGDKTENSKGAVDMWIVKLDSAGVVQWDKTVGGSSYDYLYSIQQTSDGGFICGGISSSGISGDKTENSQGAYDYWVVKLDDTGDVQWDNTIGGSWDDFLETIQQTSDGGYICGGTSSSWNTGDKTETTWGLDDYWIVKLDPAGVIQWQNTIGSFSDDIFNAISQTYDGGYICVGNSDSNTGGDKTENNQGSFDFWVLKLDTVGTIQWQNTIGGSSFDVSSDIWQTLDGGYICGGFTTSNISGDQLENIQGVRDYFIMKLDDSGRIQWQNTIGGTGYDVLNSLQQTADGGFVVGGVSDSGISGDKTENCQGGVDYWIVKLAGKYNLIQGVEFADLNSNTVKDAGEPANFNKKVTEVNTGRIAFTDNDGFYTLSLPDSGTYQVVPAPELFYTSNPGNHTVSFSGNLQIDSLNDFAFQPAGTYNDLCVNITPTGPFRSGMNGSYLINYINQGTTTLSPTVIFYPDGDLTFVSSNPVASLIATDSVVWSFGPVSPFQSGQILVTVHVNSGLPIGTLINSGAVIEPIAGDANTVCNQSYWEVLTIGSFDPNDILVNRDTVFDYEMVSPPFLDYLIRFQNTGNDTAFYVEVDNKIISDLQLDAFEFVASSHPCNIAYQSYDSTMKFIFNSILLPDSNTNEPASHGFVRYRIKPKSSLVAGDSIRNSARILFDYNAPVETNMAITEIVMPVGLDDAASHLKDPHFTVFPNPVTDEIKLELLNCQGETVTVELFDVYGRKISQLYSGRIDMEKWNDVQAISDLPKGVYIITVIGKTSASQRIIKL